MNAKTMPALAGQVEPTVSPSLAAKLRKADADVKRAWGARGGNLYAEAYEAVSRWEWLKNEATAEQWERASHALDVDAEIDAMRRGC